LKIRSHTIPFLIALFVVAWLDRVNVGFAKLQMLSDLGLSEAVYGFGAGIFYLGYLLFEIPSNLALERIGARKTLTRITVLWGATSIATMFVKTAVGFYLCRFLLGVFEAGLYPGVILYLTYWFPAKRRAGVTGIFMTAVPIAGIIGGPISGWIMSSMASGKALANWQWLFLLEGIPSITIGLITWFVFVDTPSQADWLTAEEKEIVLADLAEDRRASGFHRTSFADALRAPEVWLLTIVYFCVVSGNPTLGFWGPTIINDLGVKSDSAIGLLSAIPYLVSVIAILLIGRHSDRHLERRYHCALSCMAGAAGLVFIGVFEHTAVLAFVALILGVAGVLSAFAPFWQIPSLLLSGTAAAGGIALINSIGNLSGWIAPFAVGWLKDVTGKTSSGLYVVAAMEAFAAILIILFIPAGGIQR
jgi:D-galactonate transporter